MAAMRAGVNHWQAGLIEVGHGMVCKAYAILLVTHGPTHPITKDLEVNAQVWFKACEHVTSGASGAGRMRLKTSKRKTERPSLLLVSQAMRMQTEMELRMFKQNEYVYHSMRDAALQNKPMTMMHEPKGVEEGIKNLFHRRK